MPLPSAEDIGPVRRKGDREECSAGILRRFDLFTNASATAFKNFNKSDKYNDIEAMKNDFIIIIM